MCGGFGQQQSQVTDAVRQLVRKHQPDAEAILGRKFAKFEPVRQRSQVVAGVNYNVKIDTGNPSDFVHLVIYEHFSGNPTELVKAFGGRNQSSPLNENNSSTQ